MQSESPWQRNDAITLFIHLCVSQYLELGVGTYHNCLHYGKV